MVVLHEEGGSGAHAKFTGLLGSQRACTPEGVVTDGRSGDVALGAAMLAASMARLAVVAATGQAEGLRHVSSCVDNNARY